MNPNFPEPAPKPKSGLKFRSVALITLLAFAGGSAVTIWAESQYGILNPILGRAVYGSSADKTVAAPSSKPIVAPNVIPTALPETASAAPTASITPQSEAMMIATAARRAVETGSPLGNLDGQLQQRFGAVAPAAVTRVINAAARPITLSALQSEFAEFGDTLLTADADTGLWNNFQREMRGLFVLRRGPPTANAPVSRMDRARQFVSSGDIASAIDQIAPLPGAARAANWLARARTFVTTRQALDVIERAAIANAATPVVSTPAAPATTEPLTEDPPADRLTSPISSESVEPFE